VNHRSVFEKLFNSPQRHEVNIVRLARFVAREAVAPQMLCGAASRILNRY
jgi:hypothetical protein